MSKLKGVAARLGLLIGAVVLGSCGVPLDNEPERIPDQQPPADTEGAPRGHPSTTVRTDHAPTVELFFVRGDRLVRVWRPISGPASLARVLEHVLAGPAPHERHGGVRSAINPETRIREALLHDGVASIDLSAPFGDVQGEDHITAIAQIVFSCTAFPGVQRVHFRLEGRPVEVPVGDGTLTLRPLTRADFLELAPP